MKFKMNLVWTPAASAGAVRTEAKGFDGRRGRLAF